MEVGISWRFFFCSCVLNFPSMIELKRIFNSRHLGMVVMAGSWCHERKITYSRYVMWLKLFQFLASVYTWLSIAIKPFHANVPFLYPLKGFLMSSGSIEMEYWREMPSVVRKTQGKWKFSYFKIKRCQRLEKSLWCEIFMRYL